jgi:flagellar biosynthesis protein FlhF
MMQVKKFRAATTREALEQIKQELGQDAFVLETKQVRKSGFFGIGKGAMEIEISAAASLGTPASQKTETKAAIVNANVESTEGQNFIFSDDTPATPAILSAQAISTAPPKAFAKSARKTTSDDLLSILASRGFSTNEESTREESAREENEESSFSSFNGRAAGKRAEFEPVEISPEAPQIVHPKREIPRSAQTAAAITAAVAAAEPEFTPAAANLGASHTISVDTREMEFLRAELREVKFALGKMAYRTNAAEYQRDHDHEFLGGNYESPFHEAYIELATLGVPSDMAKNIVLEIIPELRGSISREEDISRLALTSALSSRLTFAHDPLQPDGERVLAFIGPTGVGKTTTIAKLAARVALQQGRRVELIALDTYRIGAVEQLKTYAEIIGAGCHTVRSVLELDALLRRLPQDATILIDSTGKSPHDLADQYNLAEYLRLNDDIKKCLVIQATTHPADADSAIRKFKMYGPDYLAVTKFDETERPGALLEVMAESALPLVYFCMGQRVPEDLQEATLSNLVSRIVPKN